MKLVRETLNEVQNFERGIDPKKSLDIGKQSLVKNIDSDDLYLLFNVMDTQTEELIDYEEFLHIPNTREWMKKID